MSAHAWGRSDFRRLVVAKVMIDDVSKGSLARLGAPRLLADCYLDTVK